MRDLRDIQTEYSQLCSQAGDMQYKILCYQDQLAQFNTRIRELNQEANALKEATDGTKASTTEGTITEATSETSVPASIS